MSQRGSRTLQLLEKDITHPPTPFLYQLGVESPVQNLEAPPEGWEMNQAALRVKGGGAGQHIVVYANKGGL